MVGRAAADVHPQARERLRRIEASGEPPLEMLLPADARAVADARVIAGGLDRPAMASVADLTCPGPAGPIRLRCYRPTAAERLPLVIFYHGGGFMVGNLETHDALCRQIAKGCGGCVVAIDYRLAPEHRFPAGAEDCLAATRWVLSAADDIGVDADRVALVGESSGGTMVAAIAQTLAAERRPGLALQAMIYPMLDATTDGESYERFAEGFFFTRAKARYFIDHYLRTPEDAADPRASPLRGAALDGVAPALIVTAGLDPMLSEAEHYRDRLRAAGVHVDYRCFNGWPHGFLFWGETDAAADAMRLLCATLRRRLRPAP